MIKVIIVDDEPLIVENIKASTDWEMNGFQIIGTAFSGKAALELITNLSPDLVLTDIRMPGISGLDLIKISATEHPDVKFVVISGYADFEYAQKAMEYGAMAYCLKPLEESDLENALSKVKKSYVSNDGFASELMEYIDGKGKEDHTAIAEYIHKSGMEWSGGDEFLIIYSCGTEPVMIPNSFKHMTLKTGLNQQVVLIENKNSGNLFEYVREYLQTCNSKAGSGVSVGFGGVARSIKELGKCIYDARIAAYHFFTCGANGLFMDGTTSAVSPHTWLRQLETNIKNRDIEAVERFFKHAQTPFKEGLLNINHCFRLYNNLHYFMYKEEWGNDYDHVYFFDSLTKLYSDASSMCDDLCKLVINNITENVKLSETNIKNDTVKAVINYINDNFWKEINIKGLAQKYFINMSYLCQVFKKETGNTFTEYLNIVRINYATELITKTDYSINEICGKCGYVDYYHFNKVFKRIKGTTPLKYRNEFNLTVAKKTLSS